MTALAPHRLTLALAAGLLLAAPAARAQASIDYTLSAHHVSTTGAVLSPFKHAAFALLPLPQTDSVSLLLPGGHALTSVKYDAATGSTGWKADAMALPGGGVFESEATLSYQDAVLLGVASGTAPPGPVTVSITIDGTFTGATSQGSTGFELNAFGLFTSAYLQRQADPAHPGMDSVSLLHDGVTTTFPVAAGAAFAFTQTLSLTAPPATLGAWVPAPLHSITLGNGAGTGGCTAIHPCSVRVPVWSGPVLAAPLPIAFDVVDTLVHAGNGAGAPGESVIDQMNTARLSLQTPAGMYFALSSGALADDPAAMQRFLDTPAVPEPSQTLLCAAGLALLAAVARRRRQAARRLAGGLAVLGAGLATSAAAQSFDAQAYFAGSLHTRTVSAAGSTAATYHEDFEPPPPGEPPPPWPLDPGYRFDAEAHASGAFAAGSPVFHLDALFRGTHLMFDKAPDIPFGSTPTAQARVTLRDSTTPTDPLLAPGAPLTFKLSFTLTGLIDRGPLCAAPCVALDFAHGVGGLTATAQSLGSYTFAGFGAGASLWEPELPGLNGVAQDLVLDFYAHIRADRDEALALGLLAHPGYYNAAGSIDFSHTVRLTGISAHDAQGVPLPGFALASSGGFSYAVAVPEPATIALLASGLAVLALRRSAAGGRDTGDMLGADGNAGVPLTPCQCGADSAASSARHAGGSGASSVMRSPVAG